MSIFLFILTNNIVPIFTLIALGYFISKKFDLDIFTLTKLNFYIFVPSFTLVNLYTTEIPIVMFKVVLVTTLILLFNTAMTTIISRIRGYDEGLKNAFANSILFYNAGNIGLPLITLIFSSGSFVINGETPYLNIALTTQIIILVVQNIATNSLGFLNAGRATLHWKQSMFKILKMPTIYAIPIALVMKTIPYDFTEFPIWSVLEYGKNGLVPISLLALGIQLSRTTFELNNRDVYLSNIIRLFVGPLFALFLIYILDIDGVIAQVVMIAVALPTAVNSALIAVEFDNYPDFASQVVMTSTLLSGVSLILVIYIANVLFPL